MKSGNASPFTFDADSHPAIDCSRGLPGLLELPESKHRVFCGEIDIRIAQDGTWYYEGSPFTRKELVCLFASVLHKDRHGDFWMATPAELGRITVDDAPFVAVEMYVGGEDCCDNEPCISFRTNVDDMITADSDHPIRVEEDPETGEPSPYVTVRDGLEARLTRSVFYELVSHGIEEEIDGEKVYGIWSKNQFFPLGKLNSA